MEVSKLAGLSFIKLISASLMPAELPPIAEERAEVGISKNE